MDIAYKLNNHPVNGTNDAGYAPWRIHINQHGDRYIQLMQHT